MSRTALPARIPVPAAVAALPVALAADLGAVAVLRRWLALSRTPTIAIALAVTCAVWLAATALISAASRRAAGRPPAPG